MSRILALVFDDAGPGEEGAAKIRSRLSLTAGLFVLAGGLGAMHFTHEPLISALCREDGWVENLTALFYLIASVLFVKAGWSKGLRGVFFFGFALLFFLVAGEEVSWGQRFFGVQTPEWLGSVNVQQETNLHNIEGVHGSVRALGLLFILGVCFIAPLLVRFSEQARALARRFQLPIFPLWITGTVVIAILFMVIPRFILKQIIFNLDELGEIYLAFAFLLFGVSAPRLAAELDQQSATAPAAGGE
jgi:hypothetical protein